MKKIKIRFIKEDSFLVRIHDKKKFKEDRKNWLEFAGNFIKACKKCGVNPYHI